MLHDLCKTVMKRLLIAESFAVVLSGVKRQRYRKRRRSNSARRVQEMISMSKDSPLIKLLRLRPRARRIFFSSVPEDGYSESPLDNSCSYSWVVPPELFTAEEIEELRRIDESYHYQRGGGHIIANFLPDGIRPDDVPPL